MQRSSYTRLGQIIKEAREREMLSQGELAGKIAKEIGKDLDPKTVSRWETGENLPRGSNRRALTKILGLNSEDINEALGEVKTNQQFQTSGDDSAAATPLADNTSETELLSKNGQYSETESSSKGKPAAKTLSHPFLEDLTSQNWIPLLGRKQVVPVSLVAVGIIAFLVVMVILSPSFFTFFAQPHNIASSHSQFIYKDNLMSGVNSKERQNARWLNNANCRFYLDGFHVTTSDAHGEHACVAYGLSFSDVDITVEMKINKGAFVTLYFRSKVATLHNHIIGYYFRVNDRGEYSLQYNAVDKPTLDEKEIPWTIPDSKSPNFSSSDWNTIRIRIKGSNFSFWLNNGTMPGFSGTGLNITKAGIIGFGATTINNKPPLDVVFRNLTVLDLGNQ